MGDRDDDDGITVEQSGYDERSPEEIDRINGEIERRRAREEAALKAEKQARAEGRDDEIMWSRAASETRASAPPPRRRPNAAAAPSERGRSRRKKKPQVLHRRRLRPRGLQRRLRTERRPRVAPGVPRLRQGTLYRGQDVHVDARVAAHQRRVGGDGARLDFGLRRGRQGALGHDDGVADDPARPVAAHGPGAAGGSAVLRVEARHGQGERPQGRG